MEYLMTTDFQIDQNLIAELIATKLASDPEFQKSLVDSIARQAYSDPSSRLRVSTAADAANLKIREGYQEAVARSLAKIEPDFVAMEAKILREAESSLRAKFETVRAKSANLLSEEWIQRKAGTIIHSLVHEAFGRKAHEVANQYLASSANKIDLIMEKG